MEKETTIDDLMGEFDFQVEGVEPTVEPQKKEEDAPKPDGGAPEDKTGEPKKNEGAEGKEGGEAPEGTEPKKQEPEVKKEEEAPKGKSDSFYKSLALKYIERGDWSDDFVLEGEDGQEIPLSEVEDLDEETFFQIQEAIKEQREEERKAKYLEIDGVDDRRKKLIEIVKEGGDLTEIFQTAEQAESYVNPFKGLDLDNEDVQARVYLNALMKYNNLDQDTAMAVVEKAKKDLTLDTKAKGFVDHYTKQMDEYVENKKQELVKQKEEERTRLKEFKKSLSEEYKQYGLDTKLINKLTSSAVTEAEEGYEIDSVYDKKMRDPKEAADLILFLTDKDAYLEMVSKRGAIEEQKKVRRKIKLMPKEKAAKSDSKKPETTPENEFDFKVEL